MGTRRRAGVLFFLFGLVPHDAWALSDPHMAGMLVAVPVAGESLPGLIRPCVPQPEVCNFRDDDCDGAIDNGLGILTCGIGACRSSVPACSAGVAGRCIPHP